MALTAAEYSDIYSINSDQQTALEAVHGEGHLAHLAIHPEDNPFIAGVLKEIKDLQKELDYLRVEILANKNKTGITNSQASAITANTAKTGITPSEQRDIAGNKTSIANNVTEITKLTRGKLDMVTLPLVQPSVEQGVECGVVYDSKAKTYSMMFAYSETITVKGKKQTVTRTGSIQLK